MDEITKKTFELFQLVTNCCDRIGIPYYTGFFLTKLASLNMSLPEKTDTMELYLHESDLPKLVQNLKKIEWIELESLQKTPCFYDLYTKVTDKRTTAVDLSCENPRTACGCSVRVVPVRPYIKKSVLYRKRRNLFLALNRRGLFCLARLVQGYTQFGRPSFNKTVVGKVCLCIKRDVDMEIPVEFFQTPESLQLEGQTFSALTTTEEALRFYYSDLEFVEAFKNRTNNFVFAADIPYSHFKRKRNLFTQILSLISRFIGATTRKDNRYIKSQKIYFFRTIARFQLYDQYIPQKDYCIQLINEKNWEKLYKFLIPYLEQTIRFYRQHIPFAFDRDYYDSLCVCLQNVGNQQDVLEYLKSSREQAMLYLEDDRITKGV